MKKKFLLVIGLILIVPILYALINPSQGSHPSQTILNSGGSVFNNDGHAYLCDSLSEPSSSSDVTSDVSHPIQQFSKSSTNLNSVDSNNNGWPDSGMAITGSSTPTQIASGLLFHDLSGIKRNVGGALNQKIDSDGNGWPDKCDCVPAVYGEWSDTNNACIAQIGGAETCNPTSGAGPYTCGSEVKNNCVDVITIGGGNGPCPYGPQFIATFKTRTVSCNPNCV